MVKQSDVNRFLDAASNGNLQEIERLHANHGDQILERKGRYQNGTALQHASFHGHIDVVKYLIETGGADVNTQDGYGDTAIYYALRSGQVNVAEYLHDKGQLDLHDTETYECYQHLMHLVCYGGHLQCLQFLVSQRIDVTPNDLHTACENGHLDIVKYLFSPTQKLTCETFSFFDIHSVQGEDALRMASSEGHLHIVQYLIGKLQEDDGTKVINGKGSYFDWEYDNCAALATACHRGHLNTARYLINHGAEVNGQGSDTEGIAGSVNNKRKSNTAIKMAVIGEQVGVVQFLLQEAGATVHPSEGTLLLNIASTAGSTRIMRLLCHNVPSLDVWACEDGDEHGYNPLMVASKLGHWNVIEYLCSETTATATMKTPGETTTRLNSESRDGWTALELASAHGHANIVRHLWSLGGEATTKALYHAVIRGYDEIAVFLCQEANVDIGATTDALTGRTLLHVAIELGWRKLAHYFIRHHKDCIDIDAQYHATGWTALHEATKSGRFEVFLDLTVAGANPNLKDETGTTPLHFAVERDMSSSSSRGNVQGLSRVKYLLERGADPLALNAQGDTPLSLAVKGHDASVSGEEDGLSLIYELLRAGGFLALAFNND